MKSCDTIALETVIARPTSDPVEIEAFVHLEPFNRANAVSQRILDIVEKRRRRQNVRARCLGDLPDCSRILAGMKTCERITTTPMPNKYAHMLSTLLLLLFTRRRFASRRRLIDHAIPLALLAMAFYGAAEVAKKMENPFGWEAPSHDLSQLGAELFASLLESTRVERYLCKEMSKKRSAKINLKMRSSQRASLKRYFSALGKHARSNSIFCENFLKITIGHNRFFHLEMRVFLCRAAKLVVNRAVRDRDLPPVDRLAGMALES